MANNVDDPRREPSFGGDGGHEEVCAWGSFRCFDDDRVTAGDGEEDGADEKDDGGVPGDDFENHAVWLFGDICRTTCCYYLNQLVVSPQENKKKNINGLLAFSRLLFDTPADSNHCPGDMLEQANATRDIHLRPLLRRAGLQHRDFNQFSTSLLKNNFEVLDELSAFGVLCTGPSWKSCCSGLGYLFNVVDGSSRRIPEKTVVGRIIDGEGLGRGDLDVVDEEGDGIGWVRLHVDRIPRCDVKRYLFF